MKTQKKIYVSENDRALLAGLAFTGYWTERSPYARFIHTLRDELKKARVLPADKLPADVVTINSKVWITYLDSDATDSFTLVMPSQADGDKRLSVSSPLGMAILGYRAGDNIDWGPVERSIRIRVERVAQESEGDDKVDTASQEVDVPQAMTC